MAEGGRASKIIGYLVGNLLPGSGQPLTVFCLTCWEQAKDRCHVPSWQMHKITEAYVQRYDLLCDYCGQSLKEQAKEASDGS